jgi:phosphoribosylformylglycinamidine synthase subunit PurQ / glutaminase
MTQPGDEAIQDLENRGGDLKQFTFGILQFPGSNSDQDCIDAVEVMGHKARYVWHKEENLGHLDAVLVPGGFSYGDYLRAGAIARFSPVMKAVSDFAAEGGLVLGICNGFQILCEAGLLPGALIRNRSLQFRSEFVHLSTRNTQTPFTSAIPESHLMRVPIAHGEGCYFADETTLEEIEANHQILWQYTTSEGNQEDHANPNGSVKHIAGVCNKHQNVAALMPHPERACQDIIGSKDGRWIFMSLIDHLNRVVSTE